jgi:serine/threonine-protein kinase HipA
LRIAEAARVVGQRNRTRDFLARTSWRARSDFSNTRASVAQRSPAASGAGGDSPKLLLREDRDGRFHADGALDDAKTARCWLVKFPRSRKEIDRTVLEAEAGYHRVARRFGVRTFGDVEWERDCLFVPRFDRVAPRDSSVVERLAFESLCSLSGVSDFGVPIAKETQASALAKFATDAASELREFLLRDVLDVALGNTDNHARNTAVLKRRGVALSPLFDFAPMCLDSEGIARVCRWKEEDAGFPRWGPVARSLGPDVLAWVKTLAERVRRLPAWLDEERVPARVREEIAHRIERVARDLEEAA